MGNLNDLTGKTFGDWRTISPDKNRPKYKYYWNCECINCGNKKSICTSSLTSGHSTKCDVCNKSYNVPSVINGYEKDLTGMKFGRLTVESFSHSEYSHSHWNCLCECGNKEVKSISYLNKSKFKMCKECMHSYTKKEPQITEKTYVPFEEIAYQTKENKIDIQGDVTIFNDSVIIDTKRLEEILSFKRYVSVNSGGYPYINWRGRELFLHRFVVELPQYFDNETQLIAEHKNGNRLDCREENLRVCHKSKNAINCGIYKNNVSGYKGISWNPRLNKYQVGLQCGKKSHYLGVYTNLEDAVRVRKEAEEKYFKEYNRNEEDLDNVHHT